MQVCGLYVLLQFIFNDSYQSSYLKIYQTDLRQVFSIGTGRTIAVDDQSEISFFFDPSFVTCMGVAVHRRLVVQPGGLTLGFVLHLVFL